MKTFKRSTFIKLFLCLAAAVSLLACSNEADDQGITAQKSSVQAVQLREPGAQLLENVYLLTKEVPVKQYEASAEDGVLQISFSIKNSFSEPLHLIQLETDCDCVLAAAKTEVIAPGEIAVINAQFIIGLRRGIQKRVLKAHFAELEEPVNLPFTVNIPEVLKLSSRELHWPKGEKAQSQLLAISSASDEPFIIKNIKLTSGAFHYKLIEQKPGYVYELHLKPTTTEAAHEASLIIETDNNAKAWKRIVIKLRVN
jgi:hypothetical protein